MSSHDSEHGQARAPPRCVAPASAGRPRAGRGLGRNATGSMRSSSSAPAPPRVATRPAQVVPSRCRPTRHDLEHAPPVVEAQLQPAGADVEHVAAAQPRRPGDPRAVVEHARVVRPRAARTAARRAGRARRAARPRAPARRCRCPRRRATRESRRHRAAARRAARAGSVRRSNRLLAADHERRWLAARHHVSSRRTSRKPARMPTTV